MSYIEENMQENASNNIDENNFGAQNTDTNNFDAQNADEKTFDAETINAKSAGEQNATSAKSKNGKTAFLVLVAVVLVITLAGFIKSLVAPSESSFSAVFTSAQNMPNMQIFGGKGTSSVIGSFKNDYIASISIEGTIQEMGDMYDHAWLMSTIDELIYDDYNTALLLEIDSPGGAVYQADELYLQLERYKKETERPVWAYFKSMAASGGYYIACAADKIIANRNCLTGSIGVIFGSSIDLTEIMQKHGIKMTTFSAGKNKNMLNYDEPVTEEQRAIMQSILDECYEQFTGIVAQSRALTLAQVKEIADGRVYTAKQAKELKLVDEIMGYEDALEQMKKELFDDEDYDLQYIDYTPKKSFYQMLLEGNSGTNALLQKFANVFGLTLANDASAMLLQKVDTLPKGLLYYAPLAK